jgi:hypothetical protein
LFCAHSKTGSPMEIFIWVLEGGARGALAWGSVSDDKGVLGFIFID